MYKPDLTKLRVKEVPGETLARDLRFNLARNDEGAVRIGFFKSPALSRE